MKIPNKILVGSLAIVIIGAFTVSSAMAYQGDYSKQGPAYSPERHTAMIEAMDNNNYGDWMELMSGRGRVTEIINAENFAQFVDAHRLAKTGDIAGADIIRQELGLRTSNGEKVGAGHGQRQGRNNEERQGYGRMNNENRGQNQGGKFIDVDGNGVCDNL